MNNMGSTERPVIYFTPADLDFNVIALIASTTNRTGALVDLQGVRVLTLYAQYAGAGSITVRINMKAPDGTTNIGQTNFAGVASGSYALFGSLVTPNIGNLGGLTRRVTIGVDAVGGDKTNVSLFGVGEY